VLNQNYKMAKYSQITTIFVSYERVDHIAVYNYMFRPLGHCQVVQPDDGL